MIAPANADFPVGLAGAFFWPGDEPDRPIKLKCLKKDVFVGCFSVRRLLCTVFFARPAVGKQKNGKCTHLPLIAKTVTVRCQRRLIFARPAANLPIRTGSVCTIFGMI